MKYFNQQASFVMKFLRSKLNHSSLNIIYVRDEEGGSKKKVNW